MSHTDQDTDPRHGRRRALRGWWPAGLSLALGAVLALQRWGVLHLSEALEVLVRITFVTAIAGWIIADFLRFLVWWFWTRHQP